ncbi:hypothetical protein EDD16DRAFT_1522313 [Pisolithus croceorrhizus]|nr:hypothetical protein EDD16DRAFT_1522313 [Pisolithus croceorrhizus]KAI6119698.1 hypothetical protein EV401DRAFT_1888070 [Pisolithus croceorrhizus]KAI6156319.1 hypothetical protein EDD17DRAFT_1512508 [Pisolithus thermaeus]
MGNEVINTSFSCEKVMSGMCSNGKDGWNVMFMDDDKVGNDPFNSLDVSNDGMIPMDIIKDRGDRYYVINSSIKKVMLCLKDTVNTILPPKRKYTLEEEALEEVKEVSSKLQAAHAALWKAYKGTIGIQETFTRVMDASARLDAICNKLSLLKNSNDSLKMEHVNAEGVSVKPDPAHEDTAEPHFEHTSASPCCVLPHHCGNPNLDQASLMKPWAYYIIPFDPIDIPMQLAKRKAPIDTSTTLIHKHAKLEVS